VITLRFNVIVEKDQDGYYAYCPDLKGCNTQGKSFEEVIENMRDAIKLYVESLKDEKITLSISEGVSLTTIDVSI